MDVRDFPHLEEFHRSLETWTDERFVTRKELGALAMFNLYLVNLAEADDWTYDGHSLRMGEPMCCLTVKATIEGQPYVVFTSGRTPTGCIVAFIRKLEAEVLEWRKDRYRW